MTPQSKSAALRPADFTQGVPPYDPEKLAKEMIILNRESNEKVCIRVRLTEEENQKKFALMKAELEKMFDR